MVPFLETIYPSSCLFEGVIEESAIRARGGNESTGVASCLGLN